CSLETEENEAIVHDFRETHSDFAVSELNIPAILSARNGSIRTWPHRDDTDGFFVTAFQREN
ncbi:MAG TPA: hypothetical protein VN476_14110, partial [Pyrinomonadaceae bacterium]|nr:hypothetical protein [Pyrinomonadaceae bacterium]